MFGGVIADFHWSLPFFIPSFSVLVGIFVIKSLKNPEPEQKHTIADYFHESVKSLSHWNIIRLYILTMVIFILTFGPVVSVLPLWMSDKYGSSMTMIGLVISTSSLTSALMSSQLGYLTRKFRIEKIMGVAFLLYAVTLIWIPQINISWMIILPILLFGAAQGINLPSSQTLMINAAPYESRGVFLALNATVILTGITLGPFLAALTFNKIGLEGLYYAGGGVALVFGIILLFTCKNLKQD